MSKENPIIQVKHLSKRYQIGMDRTYKTFCESAVDTLKSPLKRLKSFSRQEEVFWALKDINFEVYPGEVVGIIGRNGAGKSTLLKILSRITHPTEGEVVLRGRVASLLEVGTGFHPELTGRENIYFNGAILGMTKQEIEDKFDEIVEFSGVADFLDTPLKRYSSGMQVRLAFSVAAHLEPEILVVDEVLAVGDVEFQKKCLGKMKDVATGGRTVLFVSHNMGAIQRLCSRAIFLYGGYIKEDGEQNSVIDSYLSEFNNHLQKIELSNLPRTGNYGKGIRFVKGWLVDAKGNPTSQYRVGDRITIFIELESRYESYDNLHINISINTALQTLITTVTNRTNYGYISYPKGKVISAKVSLDNLLLSPGTYNVNLSVGKQGQLPFDVLINILPFKVIDTASKQVVPHPNLPGLIQTVSSWEISESNLRK